MTKLDAIASFNLEHTGHVETSGDDSIPHVPVGRKLMIIPELRYLKIVRRASTEY